MSEILFDSITKPYASTTVCKLHTVEDVKKYIGSYFYYITIPSVYIVFYDAHEKKTIIYDEANLNKLMPKIYKYDDANGDSAEFNVISWFITRSRRYRSHTNFYKSKGLYGLDTETPYINLSDGFLHKTTQPYESFSEEVKKKWI